MDHRIKATASKKYLFLSSTHFWKIWRYHGGSAISTRTIRRKLIEFGLFDRRYAKKSLISKHNVKFRLQFILDHINLLLIQL
jgi:hypothetical protein